MFFVRFARAIMLGRPQLFVNGAWVEPVLKGSLDLVNPATEKVVGVVGAATAEDVAVAVTAARAAFKSWKRTSGAERARLLHAVAAGVRARKEELAALEVADCGKPLDEALWDMDDVATTFDVRRLPGCVPVGRDPADAALSSSQTRLRSWTRARPCR